MDSCGGGGGRSRCTWWVADVGLGWLRKQADRRTRGDAGGQVVPGAGIWSTVRGSVAPMGGLYWKPVVPLPIYERLNEAGTEWRNREKWLLKASRPSVGQD